MKENIVSRMKQGRTRRLSDENASRQTYMKKGVCFFALNNKLKELGWEEYIEWSMHKEGIFLK